MRLLEVLFFVLVVLVVEVRVHGGCGSGGYYSSGGDGCGKCGGGGASFF